MYCSTSSSRLGLTENARALPEKAAVPSVKRFDPFRGCFLYLFDGLSLGNSSRERCDNMNVTCNTAHVHEFGTEVATGCGQICMHARPNFAVQPWLAILRAEDDVNDNLAKGLRHGGMMTKRLPEVNRAFSAHEFFRNQNLGRCPRLTVNAAALPLNRCNPRLQ